MNPSTTESDRNNRRRRQQGARSFQGMTVVDSKRRGTKAATVSSEQFTKANTMRNARRRKSLVMFAMNKQMRNSAENSLIGAMNSILFEGTPMERLQTVMTKAKESGLTAEKIFGYFQGKKNKEDPLLNDKITKQDFLEGLEKVGDSVFVLTNEELDELVAQFDTDGDGLISLDEFRTYCYYKIPSLAWKAERQRLEQSGEMDILKARLSRRLSETSKVQVPCGPEIYHSSKLFWRTQANVRIHMFYCEEMDIITIQLCKESSNTELSPIYVRKMDCMINKSELDEVLLTAVQTSDIRSEGEKMRLRQKVELEFYAKFLLARIQLKETRLVPPTSGTPLGNSPPAAVNTLVPFISKLSSDECQTVIIQKPEKLASPAPLKRASLGEFERAASSFEKEARSARTSRQSAQDMSSLVESALSEVSSELSLDKLSLSDSSCHLASE